MPSPLDTVHSVDALFRAIEHTRASLEQPMEPVCSLIDRLYQQAKAAHQSAQFSKDRCMTDNPTDSKGSGPAYKIGAVSRLTGIAPVTLRAWERRYGVVKPERNEGSNRLYSKDDIARLALIKRLVDEGNAVGTVANLPLDQLQERLELCLSRGLPGPASEPERLRVAVLGDALAARILQPAGVLPGLEVVAVERDRQAFLNAIGKHHPDVVLLEIPTVHESTLHEVDELLHRSGARRVLVIYGFGTERAVARLDTAQITPLRAPVGIPELRQLCLGASPRTSPPAAEPAAAPTIPRRRYDTQHLIRIATASTAVHCECPHHLVDLVFNLVAFETYSAECVNTSPEDAVLHRRLHASTAQARAMIEEALAWVVEAEGMQP